jgi:2-polyprenyl-3-methyl-5-hydroxy-6-metoxy-1,4-benzoquinol methylase
LGEFIKFINKLISQDSKSTAEFYNDLLKGRKIRKIVGVDNRYKIENTWQITMIEKYFDPVLSQILKPSSNLLDYGCGNGFFTKRLSELCNSVTGVDISEEFIKQASINKSRNSNFYVINPHSKSIELQIDFNACLMVDVVHHLECPKSDLEFLSTKLKKDDPIIIFEPNIKNPAIFLMHLFDKNERGLLRFMRPNSYVELFKEYITLDSITYNGILIGPANRFTNNIVRLLNAKFLKYFFGWLNPKIVFIGRIK